MGKCEAGEYFSLCELEIKNMNYQCQNFHSSQSGNQRGSHGASTEGPTKDVSIVVTNVSSKYGRWCKTMWIFTPMRLLSQLTHDLTKPIFVFLRQVINA